MKIIVTCHSYYPNHDGVQFVTQYLCEGLTKKGHEVTVVTNYYENRNMVKEEECNGVKIIRIDAKTKHTIHHGDKKGYIQLIKNLSKQNDFMINVCTQCATTDWLLKELDNINIPKILYLHSIWDFKYKKDNFSSFKTLLSKLWGNIRWKFYYEKNGKYFRKYKYVTQLHAMDYTTLFFEKKYGIKSIIIENAAESSFFGDDYNKKIELPENYILNVSNYLKRKNQLKCLELYLNSSIPDDWELILIGSQKNAYSDLIEKKYNEYKEKNPGCKKKVQILYGIPRENISTYVKKSKIYMMTSKWEAFPISLVECMAANVPFISSDVGIVKYLPGGVTCSCDKDYYFWLNEFTSNELKRKEYGKLGNLEAINRFSIEEKVNQLEKLLVNGFEGDKNE